jgi:signal transduction histidine kinase
LRSRLDESGARVTRTFLPEVIGDRTMLTQLYENLLANAMKFTGDREPTIELTAEKEGGEWVLGVKDNGIGLRPEHAELIFAPFSRLHGATEYEGSGIGLAICRKAVERHGGAIWVESEPGKGAHFKFTLPAEPTPAAS